MQPILDFLGHFVGGPGNALIILLAVLKIALVIGSILGILPFIILAERKIIAWTQDRPGPNRAGPWGLFHGLLDGIKLFFKEEIVPTGADRVLYLMAPSLVTVPAFLALCIIPIGPIIQGDALLAIGNLLGISPSVLGPGAPVSQIAIAITNPSVGVLYVLAITSVGVYGITMAGWASNSKWALLGGIRASAQMISYEIAMSLAVLGVIIVAGSLNMYDIVENQKGGLLYWHIVAQPMAFVIFLIAIFAETNRVPFDLAEGEAELTGGFHTEYSSMKFALFFLGEYVNMITASAICATLFLGGFLGPLPLIPEGSPLYYVVGPALVLPAKIALFIVLFIMARATLPRIRYDQLMDFGWKILLPLGLVNLVVTVVFAGLGAGEDGRMGLAWRLGLGAVTLAILLGADHLYTSRKKARMAAEYRNFRPGTSGA